MDTTFIDPEDSTVCQQVTQTSPNTLLLIVYRQNTGMVLPSLLQVTTHSNKNTLGL